MRNKRFDSRGAWVETELRAQHLNIQRAGRGRQLTSKGLTSRGSVPKAQSVGTGDCMDITQLLACRRLCLTLESGGVRLGSRVGIMGLQAASLHRAAQKSNRHIFALHP